LGDLETGETRQFSNGEAQDSQPRWRPDGESLAFVSTRHEDKPQIFISRLSGGDARRLTDESIEAAAPTWSTDGKRLAYSRIVATDEQTVPQEKSWRTEHPKIGDQVPSLRRQGGLMSRMDARGYVDTRQHLTLVGVAEDDLRPEPRQLVDGPFDEVDFAWSPDGEEIAFVSNRRDDREHSMGSDVWTVEVSSGALRCLTPPGMGCLAPAWSPDANQIAFLGAPDSKGCGYHPTHIYVVPREGGEPRDVTSGFDRNCGITTLGDLVIPPAAGPVWSPDGAEIYFVAGDAGDASIYAATIATGAIRRITGPGRSVASLHPAGRDGMLTGAAATPDRPLDVYLASVGDGGLSFPFNVNHETLDSVGLSEPERLTWTGPDGWEIEGWLLRPTLPRDGVAPLILKVHGGPHHMYGNTFYFQSQVLAGAGYAVLHTNPRGSTGYGSRFAAAADWGQKDFADVMAGVDAAVASGGIDPERLGITGISYGGFMTDWAVGNTDRFKAAVSVNGVSNFVSFFGVADIGPLWFDREFPECFDSPFWKDEATLHRYIERSPITYAGNIVAPLLLIQSEQDYRCPIDQGEQLLSALRYQNKVVELVRVPEASHVVFSTAAPHHRYLQWILLRDWFDRYLMGARQVEG